MDLYVCGVDWQHECKYVPHYVSFYKTVEELKEAKPCWGRCGIVKLKVEEVEWVEEQDLSYLSEGE